MKTDLTDVFAEFFASNRGPDGLCPDYGIRAAADSQQTHDVELTVTFKTGSRYCCGEAGCHFSRDWSRLRNIAAQSGITLGSPLTIRFHGVIEAGSTFTSTVNTGGPKKNDPYEYDVVFAEDGEANKASEDIVAGAPNPQR